MHRDQVGPYLRRLEQEEDMATVVMEAFERVEDERMC
jgi:hypothetical protein